MKKTKTKKTNGVSHADQTTVCRALLRTLKRLEKDGFSYHYSAYIAIMLGSKIMMDYRGQKILKRVLSEALKISSAV